MLSALPGRCVDGQVGGSAGDRQRPPRRRAELAAAADPAAEAKQAPALADLPGRRDEGAGAELERGREGGRAAQRSEGELDPGRTRGQLHARQLRRGGLRRRGQCRSGRGSSPATPRPGAFRFFWFFWFFWFFGFRQVGGNEADTVAGVCFVNPRAAVRPAREDVGVTADRRGFRRR